MIRQRLARTLTRLMRFRMVGSVPERGVLVGAPHTSNWDFLTMLLVMWHDGVHPRVLVKHELFTGPVGWLVRRLGGVPLDRANPSGVVQAFVDEAAADHAFRLVIAAEGTRSAGEYWKSGFLRIAHEAQVPVTLAFFEPSTRTMGFGPSFVPSGDHTADMDLVRAFYADKQGLKPANRTEPRLREEG
jgi:1-acyl-sn-glycerol-3-phosphate acyltransferase